MRSKLLAALALTFALSAQAYDDYPKVYFGIGAGSTEMDNKCPEQFVNCEEEEAFYQMYGGFRFNESYAVEFGYKESGDFGFRYNDDLQAHVELLTLTGLAFVPVGKHFEFFVGVGGAISVVETHDYWDYYYYDDHYTDTGVAGGILAGVQIHPTEFFTIRAQAEQWRNIDGSPAFDGDLDFNWFSLNAQFSF
ncbi:outer membrane beta-barrel protein [Permianibacter aggregans]|uniref:OmpA family protein n=1 Tax=Permianibacter aggregans TaxID=1510150 RepID=A0A4R6V1A1_9GAMM|nr:outer membrane beta-barrel protein [Permianibacter aggregans]QGX39459.1 hypothetical protein E2H98_07220 [Permianibacter aggregans]TDQ49804.1 OmpA family protein [Permianibacter aggregans]